MRAKIHIVIASLLCAGSVAALAVPAAEREVILEAPIQTSAGPGDLVALRDTDCRFVGQLERRAPTGTAGTLIQAAGADGGAWRIAVTRQVCREVSTSVRLHVDLPKAPSLAGGGGLPPAPKGYQAGTKFALLAD